VRAVLAVPHSDCALCPRLAGMREDNRTRFPDWHNAPVPAFGELSAALLVVGLAPGLQGANRTGRPFTGDYAGDLLFATLEKYGFAEGSYEARPDDGFRLLNCRVTNAVRCVPPENKPTGSEVAACRPFLEAEIAALPNLLCILALGRIAHSAVLAALGLRQSALPFAHGAFHPVGGGLMLADSYHCSRYNTNTGRLTTAMFEEVVAAIASRLAA
jgi:uracil-DNA glycosylase family 4